MRCAVISRKFGLISPKASTGSRNCWRSCASRPETPSRRGQASNRDAGFAQRWPRRKDRRSGEDDRPGERQEPDEPVARRDSRLRPAGSHRRWSPSIPIPASSGREAISARLWALLRASTQAAARTSFGAITKKGNRYLRKMLVVGCTSVLRVAHKYKGLLAEWIVAMRAKEARARRRRRPGQQGAGQDRLGDDVDWRSLPNRTLHEGLERQRDSPRQRRFSFEEIGKRNDVMNDTVATKAQDTLTSATSHELAAVVDRDQDCRISSGPAVLYRTTRPDI